MKLDILPHAQTRLRERHVTTFEVGEALRHGARESQGGGKSKITWGKLVLIVARNDVVVTLYKVSFKDRSRPRASRSFRRRSKHRWGFLG